MMRVLVIHGPNLNLLGLRETSIYGIKSLEEINDDIRSLAAEFHIEAIQEGDYDALIINPAAYTHTSIAIRDALLAVGKPSIEVHISNIYRREEFRRKSLMADVAVGQISGFGPVSYLLALRAAKSILSK
jgi:3-dehydroquinate dehydratase-2